MSHQGKPVCKNLRRRSNQTITSVRLLEEQVPRSVVQRERGGRGIERDPQVSE